MLWALALEGLKPELREELINLADQTEIPLRKRLLRARQLYLEASVFETAHRLIDKHQQRAEQVADGIEPDELRRLMYYLVDTVLDRVVDVKPTIQFTDLSFSEIVPIVSPETGH